MRFMTSRNTAVITIAVAQDVNFSSICRQAGGCMRARQSRHKRLQDQNCDR